MEAVWIGGRMDGVCHNPLYSKYFQSRIYPEHNISRNFNIRNKQDHLSMNVAPDQAIILGLQIF